MRCPLLVKRSPSRPAGCCRGAQLLRRFSVVLVMNISAMRAFGVACCVRIIACCVFADGGAVDGGIFQADRPATEAKLYPSWIFSVGLFSWVRRRRAAIAIGVVALSGVCGYFMTRVTVRMEPKAFFRPGSEPALAQSFSTTSLVVQRLCKCCSTVI